MSHAPKNILIGVLDWGIGHATRMIPVIQYLRNCGHQIVLAGNGNSLQLLKSVFDNVPVLEFKGPVIRYSSGNNQLLCLIAQIPRVLTSLWFQKFSIAKAVQVYHIHTIISDNRFYFRHKACKNIYVTHQVFPLAGSSCNLLSKFAAHIHLRLINKYNFCLIPDVDGITNLSGLLSHGNIPLHSRYIGWLSRLTVPVTQCPDNRNVLLLLSGPEPQRSIFEDLLVEVFSGTQKNVFLVRGTTQLRQKRDYPNGFHVTDVAGATELSQLISVCGTIICRSGYSTLMDLAALRRKAILVPTPGQSEQEYLANYFSTQHKFTVFSQQDLINIQPDELKSEYFWEIEPALSFSTLVDEII